MPHHPIRLASLVLLLGIVAGFLPGLLAPAFAQPYVVPASPRATLDLTTAPWRFLRADAAGAEQPVFVDSAWTDVTLPHTWNVLDGQDGGNNYYRGIGWYRRHLSLPADLAGKRLYLQFDGVNLVATVYVNGVQAGQHFGGYSGFVFDITALAVPGADNLVAVKVTNANTAGIAPLAGDWTMAGGIYRPVRLLVLDPVHVTPLDFGGPGVYLKTNDVSAASATLEITTKLRNDSPAPVATTVKTTLVDAAGATVQTLSSTQTVPAGADQDFVQSTTVAQPRLWDGRADPYLYRVHVEIVADGRVADHLSQPLGFRFYHVDKHTGFHLNGRPYDLHGAAFHEMWLDKGNAISDADRAADLGLLLEMGCTFARLAHYPHAPRTYELADEAGLVLWTEIPFVNQSGGGAGSFFLANLQDQLRELIRQNYNHPSVCVWGLQNEIDNGATSIANLQVLQALAKAEDPSRPTAVASNRSGTGGVNYVSDLQAFNWYYGWYSDAAVDVASFADAHYNAGAVPKPYGVSEYGAGGSIRVHADDPLSFSISQRGTSYHPEEYQSYFHETYWRAFRVRPYLWAKTIWNMFDFAIDSRAEGDTRGRNDKGLVTYDRLIRKDAFYYYKANWNTTAEPFAYIASRRFTPRTSRSASIRVYSNCDTVELFIDGVSRGVSSGTPDHVFAWPAVTLGGDRSVVTALGRKNGHDYLDTVEWITPSSLAISIRRPANATATLAAPGSLYLDATVTRDSAPASSAVVRAWTLVSGPAPVAFTDPAADQTTATFSATGIYILRIAATLGATTVTQDLTVSVDALATSLMARWKFDEGAGTVAADSAPDAARPATLLAGAGWTSSGRFDSAATFNGTTGRATFSSTDTDRITIAGWVRQTNNGNSSFPRLVALPGYRLSIPVGTLVFAAERSGSDSDYFAPAGLFSSGAWNHLAVTYDRTSAAPPKYFVNGVPTAAGTTNAAGSGAFLSNAGTGHLGNIADGSRALNGSIDELRLYTRVLSSDEIALLAGAATLNAPPLVVIPAPGPASVGTPLPLVASASDDGVPTPLALVWTLVSGPAQPAFSAPHSSATNVTFSAPGSYRIRLVADDGSLATAADLTIEVKTHARRWTDRWFSSDQQSNPALSGDTADANLDGHPNLLAYALGSSPWALTLDGLPTLGLVDDRLQIEFIRDPLAIDLRYAIEGGFDLLGWTVIAEGAGGAPLAVVAPGATVVEVEADALRRVSVRDSVAPGEAGRRFLRLRVTRPAGQP